MPLDSHILITAGDVFSTIGAMTCGVFALAGAIVAAYVLHMARKGFGKQ